MYIKLKKLYFIVLLLPLLSACHIESHIEINDTQGGKQTISITLPLSLLEDFNNKEEILTTLEENKPIDEIVIETLESQDSFQFSYYFMFDNLEDYQKKAYLITNQEINLSIVTIGTPFNGTTVITIDDNHEELFTKWIQDTLQSFDSFDEYQEIPIESTTIIDYHGETHSNISSTLTINQEIKIQQLDIKTIVNENVLFRSFNYLLDTNISDTFYIVDYLSTIINQIEFIDSTTRCDYLIDDQSILITISTYQQKDICLLTSSLFDTSTTLETTQIENSDQYQYIEYFYPLSSIFGDIETINYAVYFPSNAKTTSFNKIDYSHHDQYFGVIDYQENKIIATNLQQAINVDMTYELESAKDILQEQMLHNVMIGAIILCSFIAVYFYRKRKRKNKLLFIKEEPITLSIVKDVFHFNHYSFFSILIYLSILLILGYIFIHLLLPQLQIICMNQIGFSLYEMFDFLSTGKISLKDFLTLIPTVYGVTYKLKLNYYDYQNLSFSINIALLMIIPIISMWMSNSFLHLQRQNTKKRITYLVQASFTTSFLFFLLIQFKNAQISNELDLLHYQVASFIYHTIIINFIALFSILIFEKSQNISILNIIQQIGKRCILIMIILSCIIFLFFLLNHKITILPLTFINVIIYCLFVLSGGFLQINTTTYSFFDQPILIIFMVLFYLILSFGITKLETSSKFKPIYLHLLFSIIYTILVTSMTTLLNISLTYANHLYYIKACNPHSIFISCLLIIHIFSVLKAKLSNNQ